MSEAQTISAMMVPSVAMNKCLIENTGDGYDEWSNGRYYGTLRTFLSGFPVGAGPYRVIGITAIDETAHHDWRDFQQIKNDLCGPEWEAVELYPAESRLVDPSNRFYLWCVPKGVFTFGFFHRTVCDETNCIAPQRPFPKEGNLFEKDKP